MLVSFLLFFTPDGYLLEMEKLWRNELITPTIWASFMTDQLKQWADGILLVRQLGLTRFLETHAIAIQATVMLTVDVSFLTIPGVVQSNASTGNGGNTTNTSNATSTSSVTQPNQEIIFTSPALIAIALSIEASVASMVIGMLLVRHNSNKVKEPPTNAVGESLLLRCA
jgi:hypothetical protein